MGDRRAEFSGITASPGVAVGPALVASRKNISWSRHHIAEGTADHQLSRLQDAIDASRRELAEIRDGLGADAPADYRLILDAHLLMHGDELLLHAASEAVVNDEVNAEWAIEKAVRHIKCHLEQAPHPYFRDRAQDVEHVGRRIIAQLVGTNSALPIVRADSVLVVDDLHPADAVQLIKSPVLALVTGLGSATSHTSILASTMEIPSVVGVQGITERVGTGDVLIVDALQSRVVLHPEPSEIERAQVRARRYHHFKRELRADGVQALTRDGVELSLLANVDLPEEAAMAMAEGVPGIGLYRTEFLFLNRATPPDEDEQLRIYRSVVAAFGSRPLVLRTFDLGGDNLSADPYAEATPNPALGLRAVRFALSRRPAFRTQLRAILRAATEGDVRIMFPLISGVADFRRATAALAEARAELDDRGQTYGQVKVGVMIELPSAVVMADKLAREADFLSVGTNDLVQYTLAVDRSNPAVAHLADTLDPAVLRLLDHVVRAAAVADTPISMCGDMATSPLSLPIVAGLGFRTLSVPLSALPLCRAVVRTLDLAHAAKVAQQALRCETATQVHALVRAEFGKSLRTLWEEAGADG